MRVTKIDPAFTGAANYLMSMAYSIRQERIRGGLNGHPCLSTRTNHHPEREGASLCPTRSLELRSLAGELEGIRSKVGATGQRKVIGELRYRIRITFKWLQDSDGRPRIAQRPRIGFQDVLNGGSAIFYRTNTESADCVLRIYIMSYFTAVLAQAPNENGSRGLNSHLVLAKSLVSGDFPFL